MVSFVEINPGIAYKRTCIELNWIVLQYILKNTFILSSCIWHHIHYRSTLSNKHGWSNLWNPSCVSRNALYRGLAYLLIQFVNLKTRLQRQKNMVKRKRENMWNKTNGKCYSKIENHFNWYVFIGGGISNFESYLTIAGFQVDLQRAGRYANVGDTIKWSSNAKWYIEV